MYTFARSFPSYFSCPFCRFSIFVFLLFYFILSTPSWKWRLALFLLELRHIFYGLLAIQSKKIAKFLRKSERWLNKGSKGKTLENKPGSRWPFFFFHKLCDKYYRKSCRYMRDNSTKLEGKKITFHNMDQSFEHNGTGITYPKRWKALKRKRRCTLHVSMVSKGFVNFIPKNDRTANSGMWTP